MPVKTVSKQGRKSRGTVVYRHVTRNKGCRVSLRVIKIINRGSMNSDQTLWKLEIGMMVQVR